MNKKFEKYYMFLKENESERKNIPNAVISKAGPS